MKTSVLRDQTLNRRFLDDGYVVVPFLDTAAVAQVLEGFERLRPERLEPLHRAQLHNDVEYRKGVHRLIRDAFDPRMEILMNEYRAVIATFIVKEPQEVRSELPMHADTSFVDESKFMSANIWCPLVDTTRKNGCLRVIPGSEHHFFPIRVFSCRQGVVNHPFNDVMPLMKNYIEEIEVPAGHAVVYNARLIHGSGPNMSGTRRVAVVCVNTPKEAPIHAAVPASSAAEAEVFEIPDPSFFWTHQIDEPPVGAKSLGRTTYQQSQLTKADVLKSPYLRRRRSSWSDWRRLIPFG
jgi:hypothetical protein